MVVKIIRLGDIPEMHLITAESDPYPVFILRMLTSAEEIEALINTENYLATIDIPTELRGLIFGTERLALAIKSSRGELIFNNGNHLRDSLTEEQCGFLLAAYQSLKTPEVIKHA